MWGGARGLKSGLKSCGLIIPWQKREVQVHPGMLHFSVILAMIGVLLHFQGIFVQHLACSLSFAW